MDKDFVFSPIKISLKIIARNRCNNGYQYRGNLDCNPEEISVMLYGLTG